MDETDTNDFCPMCISDLGGLASWWTHPFVPNTRWRYQNSDPLTLGKIVRDKVEAHGENYLTFPQRALFDRIGVRNAILETDGVASPRTVTE